MPRVLDLLLALAARPGQLMPRGELLDIVWLVAALVAGAPRLTCLVTSQVPLQLPGEQVYRLDGLDLPPPQATPAEAMASGAVALVVARVQALNRRFALDAGNVVDVVAICRSLDGLPLALELAAARLPLLGAAALRAALEQRLQVLTQGWRAAPPRQQSLRAALAWSHGLLGAAEQTVFRRMAVFAGSGSLAMLQRVLSDASDAPGTGLDGWDVLEALDVLVRRSLLRVLPDEPGAEPRYALLESPLALAREQLAASGEAALLAQRMAKGAGCAVALRCCATPGAQATRQQLELAHTWVNLCMAQIAAGRLDAARRSARAAWPLVRQFDLHPHWADNAARLAVLEGRAAGALKLLGYAEHAYAQLGTQRNDFGQGNLARAEQAAAAQLVAAGATQTPTALKAEGQALTDAALAQLA